MVAPLAASVVRKRKTARCTKKAPIALKPPCPKGGPLSITLRMGEQGQSILFHSKGKTWCCTRARIVSAGASARFVRTRPQCTETRKEGHQSLKEEGMARMYVPGASPKHTPGHHNKCPGGPCVCRRRPKRYLKSRNLSLMSTWKSFGPLLPDPRPRDRTDAKDRASRPPPPKKHLGLNEILSPKASQGRGPCGWNH